MHKEASILVPEQRQSYGKKKWLVVSGENRVKGWKRVEKGEKVERVPISVDCRRLKSIAVGSIGGTAVRGTRTRRSGNGAVLKGKVL